MPEHSAIEQIGSYVNEGFFRAMFADPARANAVIRTHWPRQLRWMLEGAPARQIDGGLVTEDLRAFWVDSLFLVGGEHGRETAVFLAEHEFRVELGTLWKIRDCSRVLLNSFDVDKTPWLVPMVFDTREGGIWNLPGAIDETSDDPWDLLRQMTFGGMHFARQTRKMPYGSLSCEPVSRVMLGMMGLAGRRPYPQGSLEQMWRTDAVGRVTGMTPQTHLLQMQLLTFVLATSDLRPEELRALALETGLVDWEEFEMDVIAQPLILDAVERGKAEGMAGLFLRLCQQRFGAIPKETELAVRSAPLHDLEAWADSLLQARSLDEVFQHRERD